MVDNTRVRALATESNRKQSFANRPETYATEATPKIANRQKLEPQAQNYESAVIDWSKDSQTRIGQTACIDPDVLRGVLNKATSNTEAKLKKWSAANRDKPFQPMEKYRQENSSDSTKGSFYRTTNSQSLVQDSQIALRNICNMATLAAGSALLLTALLTQFPRLASTPSQPAQSVELSQSESMTVTDKINPSEKKMLSTLAASENHSFVSATRRPNPEFFAGKYSGLPAPTPTQNLKPESRQAGLPALNRTNQIHAGMAMLSNSQQGRLTAASQAPEAPAPDQQPAPTYHPSGVKYYGASRSQWPNN